jgi:hypothetical protein
VKKPTTLSEIMERVMHWPIIEPVKRVKEIHHVPRGQRHFTPQPRYIWHTYPIKGGITGGKLIAENITANNVLFRKLRERGAEPRS